MRTPVCDELGIEFPVFAFSHCRDVVAAVTRAGGLGVFGAVRHTPEQLELDLAWLDEELNGKPYGVDLIFPARTAPGTPEELRARLPAEHKRFVAELTERLGIPPRRDSNAPVHFGGPQITTEWAQAQWEVTRAHDVSLLASALGPAPAHVTGEAHEQGMLVAGLVGTSRHAEKQVEAGADIVVAQGSEAGGHTGEITSLVLVPQVVDAVAPVPVLAAGGIGNGRQIAAARAMGAQGVWTGSVWLTTAESDVHPVLKQKLLVASSQETVRSRCSTGKPSRQFRNAWVDAWQQPEAPEPLESPLQSLLVSDPLNSAIDHVIEDAMCTPLGQVVGMMHSERSVRSVMFDLVEEYIDAVSSLVADAD